MKVFVNCKNYSLPHIYTYVYCLMRSQSLSVFFRRPGSNLHRNPQYRHIFFWNFKNHTEKKIIHHILNFENNLVKKYTEHVSHVNWYIVSHLNIRIVKNGIGERSENLGTISTSIFFVIGWKPQSVQCISLC